MVSWGDWPQRVIYGERILAEHSRDFGRFSVLTSRTPWALVAGLLHHPPQQVVMVESLERSFLERTAAALPAGDAIVGVGGGMVIDAAKYMVEQRGGRLYQAPTITSSDAVFTPTISIRENGKVVGGAATTPPTAILVDYALVRQADPVWNRGGLGDILCFHVGREEWRYVARAGKMEWSDQLYADAGRLVADGMALAAEVGRLSDGGIRGLMELLERSTRLWLPHPGLQVVGVDHLLAWNLEKVTGRHFVHGQAVALGTVIGALLYDNQAERMMATLDEAQLPFRPRQLGVSGAQLAETLATLGEYNRTVRHYHTILEDVALTPQRIDALCAVVEA